MYFLQARVYPAILTVIPILLFYFFTKGTKYNDFLTFAGNSQIFVDTSVSTIAIYLLIHVNRFLSKETFQKFYFKDEIDMPSTRFLLFRNSFLDVETKYRIRQKINDDYSITLLSEKEEECNELEARKRIVTGVSQIRNGLRDNKMLLRHNIEYGFVRNLLGGCIIAIIFCLLNWYFFNTFEFNSEAIYISQFLLIIYLLPILLSKCIIDRFGHYYSKILFEQYLDK